MTASLINRTRIPMARMNHGVTGAAMNGCVFPGKGRRVAKKEKLSTCIQMQSS